MEHRSAADPLLRSGVDRFIGLAAGVGGIALAIALGAPAHATKPTSSRAKVATPKRVSHSTHTKSTMDRSTAEHLSTPSDAADTPALRYAQLSQVDCEAELGSRQIDFIRETADGVLAPVRLTGPLHGVVFRSDAADRVRRTSPHEIVDCRLVLALDDFTEILRSHGIVEVRHYSMYRPPKSRAATDQPGARHEGALAIDAGRFIDATGAVLDVSRDFHGAIGSRTCGDGAGPRPATDAALTLRAILCEAAERRLFNVMLTPNYNRPHKNHFHLELTAGVSWFLVH
jgi:hypothetical protein